MVNPNELVDLDSDMEDILSIWGKDPTAQNIERYFRSSGTFRSGTLSPEPLKINQSFLQLSKEIKENAFAHQDFQASQQTSRPSEDGLHAGFRQSIHGTKGKSLSVEPVLSGGLEDIVNFVSSSGQRSEKGVGRVSTLTRASIAKEQGNPKGIGGRPEVEIGVSSEIQKVSTKFSLGTRVINQP